MLNSSHIQRKIDQSTKLKTLIEDNRKPQDALTELYLTILSRFPTTNEVETAIAYGMQVVVIPAKPAKPGRPAQPAVTARRREDWVDVAWSLINSTEFLYRH